MSEQAPERTAAPAKKSSGNLFTEKIGPLPMWVWVAIVAAVLVAWRLYSNKKNASSTNANTATSGDSSVPADQVPQFINQTYTTVTAPVSTPPTEHRDRDRDGRESPPAQAPTPTPPSSPAPQPQGPPPPRTPPPSSNAPPPTVRSSPPRQSAPPMPSVRAAGATASSVAAAWDRVAGATSYIVRVTYQGKLVKQLTTNATSATISGLGADHTYTVHVAAVGPGGTSPETNGPGIKTAR